MTFGHTCGIDNTSFMIEVREDHGHPLAVVSGEIDESASAALTYYVECVLDFNDADVVVDLGGVTFIDSHGLKALLRALERTSAQGHTLRCEHASQCVRKMWKLAGVDELLAPSMAPGPDGKDGTNGRHLKV